jgi:hypothetical protein
MFPLAPERPLSDQERASVEHTRSRLSPAELAGFLAAALLNYGQHQGACNVVQEEHGRPPHCSCGFAVARAVAQAMAPSPHAP